MVSKYKSDPDIPVTLRSGPGGAGDLQARTAPGGGVQKRVVEPRPELQRRTVKGPDGVDIEIEPLRDYYCEAPPTVMPAAYSRIVEDLFN